MVEDVSWGLGKLFGRIHPAYVEALTKLADALDRDSRFHGVGWFTSNQVLSGAKGAARPVDAA